MSKLINLGRASVETKGQLFYTQDLDQTGKVNPVFCPVTRRFSYLAPITVADPCIPV